ncbi:GNAT family N-acetyltransferase [Nocardiopsis coralliicola]
MLGPTSAELKRLFVRPAARGTGIARALLAHPEEAAAGHGLRRRVLHCGLNQPEAVALYRPSGSTEVEGRGPYR